MTEIIRASTQLSASPEALLARSSAATQARSAPRRSQHQGVQRNEWRLGGPLARLKPLESDPHRTRNSACSPVSGCGVKSKHAIESTLNRKLRNRGLEFGRDMLLFCGGSYRVAARVDRTWTSAQVNFWCSRRRASFSTGANANGGTVLTPQNEFFFWRRSGWNRNLCPRLRTVSSTSDPVCRPPDRYNS